MKTKFVVTTYHNRVGSFITVPNGAGIGFNVSPSANCQVGMYSNFQGIFAYEDVETRKKALIALYMHGQNKLAIIDINQVHETKVEALFPSNFILFRQKYKSTNGSPMMIFMVNTSELQSMYMDIWNAREDKNKQLGKAESLKDRTTYTYEF